ncbi:alpha-N-acetyl-neuraminyl-2,3-beta-galactosyl-1,3-N-acetyl-galactosaminide alpha-2,6-sialyltransferase-like [Asterias rubens]|uniref:alpha-N-acetyl-neuraminyl-2,3-beta-galactosyl-1, 3-N-acetyl-galactosaminide alpha-2,6-sialyltransferase-like n=1 Tax=Asterias rubens TaxID=7604 RepID=UPI001455CF69|nr:alpha-N-acetyl-neuraminyl-2,3-beta-galactosyl-1,3-N-acetyl-galactosaminide alpha-2,6-sialyltransferase-like [Asterias rubens]
MANKTFHKNRCLTSYRILVFALLYCLTCLICMTIFYDGSSTQVKVKPKNGPTQKPLRGPGKEKNDTIRSRTLSPGGNSTTGKPLNWRDEITKDLFHKKGPDLSVEDYQSLLGNKSIKFQCNQCAIVSSSGQLLGTGAGPQIDNNDCVFRMNNAPTKGYERDVGQRTTARVIGHVNLRKIFDDHLDAQSEFLVNTSTKADSIFIHWSYLTEIDKDPPPEYALAVELAKKFSNVSFNMFTPQKMKYAERLFHHETGLTRSEAKTWLSTGWYTILLAIDSCQQINIYGMVYEDYCKEHPNENVPYHYYDPNFKSECKYYHSSEVRLTSGHLFITEKAVFARWANIHSIHYFNPRWPPKRFTLSNQLLTPFVQRYQIAQNRLFSKLPIWKLFFHFAGLFYPLVH